ncbi:MAG: aldo/keto reductase [Acidobacteria bacterium]|nr:aldo/keto reductase [Acidobacteriota bacterium]MYG76122.1 aldo/keto reductase [Acidobacteriota bacterium]
MSAVERTRLAAGLEASRVLTGLWQVADQERGGDALETERAARALEPAVDAGFTTLDVADHYGSAELIAGALQRRRPEIRVLTKWVPEPGVSSRTDVEAAIERSLDRIGTGRLDALQFHAWSYLDPGWLDCLFHLMEIRAEGRIGQLGVTNFDAVHLDLAVRSGIPIVTNQVCYSLVDRRPAGPMAEVCRTHGVGLLAYGTLAGGLLSDRWLGAAEPPIDDALTWSQMKYRRFIDQAGGWDRFQAVLRAARRVADRYRVSIANVAVRYVLEQPAVAGVIVGARPGERTHLQDNLRLFDLALDERSRAELAEAQAGLDPIPGDCGDEYRRPPYLTASGDLHHHVSHFPAPYAVRDTDRGLELAPEAGFPEAVRAGPDIRISGVTPTHRCRLIGGGDIRSQTHFVVDRMEGALQSLKARLADVVRIRGRTTEADWPGVETVLRERFLSTVNVARAAEQPSHPHRVAVDVEART